MPRITISYRREDSGVITGRIFDRLVGHYGRDSVFRDIDNIPLGVDFREHINEVLDASDVVLAIVGPRWIGPRGQSRLVNEADPVRVEIEAVLRKGVPLIPVLVLRGTMPRSDQLPETLRDFAYRNAIQVDDAQDFDVHMSRLTRAMDRMLEARAAKPAVFVRDAPGAITLDRPEPEPEAETGGADITEPAAPIAAPQAVPPVAPSSIALPQSRRGIPAAVWIVAVGLLGGGAGLGLDMYLRPAVLGAAVGSEQSDTRLKTLQDELGAARQQADQDRKRLSAELAAAQQMALAPPAGADQSDQLRALQSRAEKAERDLSAEKETSANALRAAKQATDDQKALQGQLAAAQKQAEAAQQQAGAQKQLETQVKALSDELAAEKEARRIAQAQADRLTGQTKELQAKLAAVSAASASPAPADAAAAPVPVAVSVPAPVSAPGEDSWTIDQRREIQRALHLLANYRGEADGGFGAGTRAAVKEFQSYEGDQETGTLSEAERQALVQKAQRLAFLLDQPATSPEGLAADTVKGGDQRYARGWAAETGKGARQDPAEAAYWYALAAGDGDGRAFANLGTLVARGRADSAPDPASAALLWQAAAARGDAVAMFNLGVLYERGIGVGADPERAKAWYRRAADHNHPQARAALKRLGA